MKLSSIGFGFCAIGVLLYIANYCVAASYLPHITEWPAAKGKLFAAYSEVGYHPTMIGAALFVVGIILIIVGQRRRKPEDV
jgi:hypothetical protein